MTIKNMVVDGGVFRRKRSLKFKQEFVWDLLAFAGLCVILFEIIIGWKIA